MSLDPQERAQARHHCSFKAVKPPALIGLLRSNLVRWRFCDIASVSSKVCLRSEPDLGFALTLACSAHGRGTIGR